MLATRLQLLHSGYGMEPYKIDPAVHPAYQAGKRISMTHVVINPPPHYILDRQPPLMAEIIFAQHGDDIA